MDCKYVKDNLENYLGGDISDEDNDKISKHLTNCDECMESMLKKSEGTNNNSSKKIFLKTRRKLINRIALITVLFIISSYILISVVIPGIGSAFLFYGGNLDNHTRAFADLIQFSQPSNVGGYGNKPGKGLKFYTTLQSYTHTYSGTKVQGSRTYETKLYYFKKGIESPIDIFVDFIHPKTSISESLSQNNTIEESKKILNKNGDNTVATVNISLNNFLNMNDIEKLLKNYDVKILWMAIECGEEATKPKNISHGLNQYVQWGIPSNFFSHTTVFDNNELTSDNTNEYEELILNEMKWLDENKKLIKPNKSLLKNHDIDTSVGSKARYVLDNGIKIYGLRLTGPSDEIARIHEALDIRYEVVDKIDFWYWK